MIVAGSQGPGFLWPRTMFASARCPGPRPARRAPDSRGTGDAPPGRHGRGRRWRSARARAPPWLRPCHGPWCAGHSRHGPARHRAWHCRRSRADRRRPRWTARPVSGPSGARSRGSADSRAAAARHALPSGQQVNLRTRSRDAPPRETLNMRPLLGLTWTRSRGTKLIPPVTHKPRMAWTTVTKMLPDHQRQTRISDNPFIYKHCCYAKLLVLLGA